MANHIVRVYRSGKGPPPWLVGVVEEIAGEERYRFKSAEELWAVLVEMEGVGVPRPTAEGEKAKG